jgi:hypothetical protein
MAESAPSVTVDSETILRLLDAAESVNVKIVPKKEKREQKPGSEEDERCARWMYDVLLSVDATARKPNFATWARDVRVMREIDDRTHKEIGGLFRWALHDSFWCQNIQCPRALRKNWGALVMKRRQAEASKQPAQLGKQGQTTAQNAQRWLEESGHAA